MASRAERLLALTQLLRRHRQPVAGQAMAQALGISLRTLYRDIASLQAQGARIDGAPGLGYVMQPGHELPPLMFTTEEIEALVLGSRWVVERAEDPALAAAARDALAKIAAVLPGAQRHTLDSATLLVGPAVPDAAASDRHLPALRQAIRDEQPLRIHYADACGQASERVIWPFALGFFDRVRVLVAWCELRSAIRHFRTDRLAGLAPVAPPGRYPVRRAVLLRRWRQEQGIRTSAADGI